MKISNNFIFAFIPVSVILVLIAWSCSVYKSPARFEAGGIISLSVADSRNGKILREISAKDSINVFISALNVNENVDYETDTTYRILLISETKDTASFDTTKIFLSVRGDEFSYFNTRKNPYGKVLSRGTEYFRVTKPLAGFLLGAATK